MALRVVIVDDEALARRRLRRLLDRHGDVEVVAEAAGGEAAVAILRRERPDLVLLDVQMPDLDGFEVLAALDAVPLPAVIFVTAHDQHAVRAFEVQALDYLLKPFDDQRFEEALRRARDRSPDDRAALHGQLETLREVAGSGKVMQARDRLVVRSGGRVAFLKLDEIDWLEARNVYVCLHVGEAEHLVRERMTHLEERLPPERFLRIHRSTIVNLSRVVGVEGGRRGTCRVQLADGTRLPVSAGRREALQQRLGFRL